MTEKMIAPSPGGAENQVLVKASSKNGDVSWKELLTPCELFVSLDSGGSWYGGLSTAPSFYTGFVYSTGMFHLYMTGAGAQVNRVSMTGKADTGPNDYFYVLFQYGGKTPTATTRVPVVIKLDYVGRVQMTDVNLSPLPLEKTSTDRYYLYGGQIIDKE